MSSQNSTEAVTRSDVDLVIVGAGFAGMYQLFRARKLGLCTRVFERGSSIGGTWYWNRYPGARCDTVSVMYSVSYMPDLDQEWDWADLYPTQEQILAYINEIDRREAFSKDITFNTTVTKAEWDEHKRNWVVFTDTGEVVHARYVVMASGTLTAVPRTPDVPGIEAFKGRWFHTGRWPHEPVDFTGRRVAVVGTGSTGIQAISEVAKTAGTLTVFQRTPKFTLPAANRRYSADELNEVRSNYPEFRKSLRHTSFGITESAPDLDLSQLPTGERYELMERMWLDGTLGTFFLSHDKNFPLRSQAVNDIIGDFVRLKIKEIVKDPQKAETLTPYGYPIGVNRLCLDTDYYEKFNQSNVFLVDTRKEPIQELTPRGIWTTAAHYEFDDIIFATGYDAMTGSLTSIDIVGKHGRTIREDWADGPATYLGVQAHNYPNLFLVTAPGGPSVLANAIITGEQNVDFISDLISWMEAEGLDRIEADPEAQAKWMDHVAEVAADTLYREAYKANAWYTGRNVPGKKVVFMPYAGGVGTYERICEGIVADGYPGFEMTSQQSAKRQIA